MKIYLVTLFLFVLIIVGAQDFEEQTEFNEPQQPFNTQNLSAEDMQRYGSMRRTACLVLSRHHSNGYKDELESIIKSLPPEQQQKYINKMYSRSIQICEQNIQPDEVQQLFVENNNFDPTKFFPIFASVDYTAISKEDFKLTKPQEAIVQYIKQFDEEMEVRNQQKKAEQEKLEGQPKNQIKMFGFSFKELGSLTQIAYLGIFVAILAAILYYGIRQVSKDPKKAKKEKKQKKSQSKSPSPSRSKKD